MANPVFADAYRGNDGRLWINVTEAKSLTAQDSGIVQNVIYADGVVTLPATGTEGIYTVRNGGVTEGSTPGSGDAGNKIEVDCDGSDTIAGLDVEGTEADGKKLVNTALTAEIGDEVTITNGATDGGLLSNVRGTWAREA